MATRTPLYLDFANGEVREIGPTDLVAFNVTGVTADYAGQAGKYLRVAASSDVLEFATITGGGDVVGPASSVDSRIVLFDGVTGKLIKDSGVLLSAFQPIDTQLTDLAGLSYSGNALKVVRVNAGETAFELAAAGAGDISLSNNAPSGDVTITAGYSGLVNRKYTIASTKKLTIGSGAIFRIH